MPRRTFQDGMEITYQDLSAISTALMRDIYDRAIYYMLQQQSDAFFGGSCLVTYVSATSVQVAAGLGFQNDSGQASPENTKRPIFVAANTTKNLSTPDATNPRIDLVCIKAALNASEITGTRKYKAPTTEVISNETVDLQSDWEADITVVAGTPAGSPSAPSVPSGYIKIATLQVAASTGLSGSGDITDDRTKLPIGGEVKLDTSGLSRITAGASTSLDAVLSSIDGLLGSAGGGGGGLKWDAPAGFAPIKDTENGLDVFKFDPADGDNQKLVTLIRVPDGYVAGSQIQLKLGLYSPSSDSTSYQMRARCYLVRTGTDAISSTTNLHTSTNAELTADVANKLQLATLDLCDADGEVNSVAVAAGHMLRVELYRDVDDVDDDDTAEVRFVPSATSVKFDA